MKILFDYQTFHTQRFGGISRYFYEIGCRMKGVQPTFAIPFTMNQYIRHSRMATHVNIPKRPFKILEGVFRLINRRWAAHKIKQGHFDLFHPTYYNPYFLNLLGKKKFVLTIHDMTHERYPQYFSPNDPTPAYKRQLAERATRIIAISECTKRDIMLYLHVPEEKIDVIYHGLSPKPLAEGKPEGLPDEYILYVGERRGYKNFELLLEAFVQVHERYPNMHLVLTGRPISKHEHELFMQKGLQESILVMNDISDLVLAQLYRHARLFVYPSLYEGFGIPILEAFAQKCPVVASRASCFPEVAGDAAAYFSPQSAQELAEAILHTLSDAAYRNQLVERGCKRLKLFTWEETARKTEETYRKALKADQ